MTLTAFVGREDGSRVAARHARHDRRIVDPEALGREVARRLRAAGADQVLGR